MRKLKVFGGNLDGRHRIILACGSITEFYRVSKVARGYACETGNDVEVGVALNEPGVLFVNHIDCLRTPYRPIGRSMAYDAIYAFDKEFPR